MITKDFQEIFLLHTGLFAKEYMMSVSGADGCYIRPNQPLSISELSQSLLRLYKSNKGWLATNSKRYTYDGSYVFQRFNESSAESLLRDLIDKNDTI